MDKLLESLIAKAKLECEEAHRQLLFAFNGLCLTSCWPMYKWNTGTQIFKLSTYFK